MTRDIRRFILDVRVEAVRFLHGAYIGAPIKGSVMADKLAKLLQGVSHLYPHKTEEKFPRIVEKIEIMWGTPGMGRYFNELLFDERGDRAGFPPDVMAELFALHNYDQSMRPSRSAIMSAWHDGKDLERLERFTKNPSSGAAH